MKVKAGDILRSVIPIVILTTGVGAFWSLTARSKTKTQPAVRIGPPAVETVAAVIYDGGWDIVVDGVVVPYREITVSAEVAGQVTFKAEQCRAGYYVEQDRPLIHIDPLDYQLAERRLSKELEQAEASLKELDVEIENVEGLIEIAKQDVALQGKELKRTKSLATSRMVTDSQIDQEQRDMLAARNTLMIQMNQRRLFATRRNRFNAAKEFVTANLGKAKLDLARTSIRSPVTGVIVEDVVEQGTYVQPGQALFTIEDTEAVEVKCTLRMDQLYWLWRDTARLEDPTQVNPINDYQIPRTPATVVYQLAGRSFTWQGTLARFDGIGLDERTRTVPCLVVVEDPRDVASTETAERTRGPKALVRGMYVTVQLHAKPHIAIVSIPEGAVRPGNVVWRVVNGKLSIEQVTVIKVQDNTVLVLSDPQHLQAGDQIVVSPIAAAHDGMEVTSKSIKAH